ncbi:potassium-transporting ATPase subunit C [Campylobacter jejuni]|nr:potassium-transporting ATPase subunit C [Campylobacter jejuni]EAI2400138.1 potassium-transporting ATPase subunit C [Campylobacter jejuni]EAV9766185.1 potassium-transporting ATPase subunit C [Campylobacter jejuni]EBF6162070.1 potassium-transporting ATPase subunit C [Campylobacter jejuni]ECP0383474.1 HAD-IC family P-type ATPase [Campylobacter jejuni]
MSKKQNKLITKEILNNAIKGAFLKFDPRFMVKNPVMFMVEVGSILTLILSIFPTLFNGNSDERIYNILITFILFITLLFANFAESIAEGRGKAQAATLRQSKKDSKARRIKSDGSEEMLNSSELEIGDIVLVKAGELIPNDGEIIEGAASVDESAITGESAPVMREAGGDFSSVTGGTTVLTDFLKIKILVGAGESFLDKMINLVEGAARQKTPNEIALNTLLIVLSLSFLVVLVSLYPFMQFLGVSLPISWLVALLVCLIPTTIGGLLSAIGIAGMDRVTRFNVIALSGKAVESCGDVDTMILDKTGTITFGNRLANEFYEVQGISKEEMIKACVLSSLKERVQKDLQKFLDENPQITKEQIPLDLLSASGSGLDPHISLQAALVQIPRISQSSKITKEELEKIIQENTESKFLGIFGEEKVNVLAVNIAIAKAMKKE